MAMEPALRLVPGRLPLATLRRFVRRGGAVALEAASWDAVDRAAPPRSSMRR
jgi:hypothetical protein